MTDKEEKDYLLKHAIINQLEVDFNDNDFESISELIQILINLEPAEKALIGYLSDTALENWQEGKTNTRY